VELNWSILAMTVAELFALKEQLDKRRKKTTDREYEPSQRSLANTMRALRYAMRHAQERCTAENNLGRKLAEALTDGYQRKGSKKARYRPANPDKKPLGDPQIRNLSKSETKVLKELRETKNIPA
jgi:hypothetical protein